MEKVTGDLFLEIFHFENLKATNELLMPFNDKSDMTIQLHYKKSERNLEGFRSGFNHF